MHLCSSYCCSLTVSNTARLHSGDWIYNTTAKQCSILNIATSSWSVLYLLMDYFKTPITIWQEGVTKSPQAQLAGFIETLWDDMAQVMGTLCRSY